MLIPKSRFATHTQYSTDPWQNFTDGQTDKCEFNTIQSLTENCEIERKGRTDLNKNNLCSTNIKHATNAMHNFAFWMRRIPVEP